MILLARGGFDLPGEFSPKGSALFEFVLAGSTKELEFAGQIPFVGLCQALEVTLCPTHPGMLS